MGLTLPLILCLLAAKQHKGMGNGSCDQLIMCGFYHSFLVKAGGGGIPTLSLLQYGVPHLGDSSPLTSPV